MPRDAHTAALRSALITRHRVDWVDVAKGICILLVVMLHSTFGVEKAIGAETALHAFIDWAQPFRMPDFFLISGLFLARRIDRPWREYLDSKVLHFAYFYLLWMHILLLAKAVPMVAGGGAGELLSLYLWSYVDPFGSLWFIYLLAIFFVVTRLLSPLPGWAALGGAALLHVVWPHTGIFLADEFAGRFVFFLAGSLLSDAVFRFGDRVARAPAIVLATGLVIWAAINTHGVISGAASWPVLDLLYSFAGIAAVVATSVILARNGGMAGEALRYCGRNSISIYLAFTLFMGPVRQVLLSVAGHWPPEIVALGSMAAGVLGALALSALVSGTRFAFLFHRPAALRLTVDKPRGSRLSRKVPSDTRPTAARQPEDAALARAAATLPG
ncbi:MAG: acyltransferase family protein [Hyphomicrobium sp.]